MANKHPYVQAPGNLTQVVNYLRKSFPSALTADTLKKLGFAPKNESYVLNVVRFLGLIDDKGKKADIASKVFSLHDDSAFEKQFSDIVRNAYSQLFELHGENAWALETQGLITFFRSTDHTTALVGKHQARTFQVLAGFAGHQEIPEPKAGVPKPASKTPKKKASTAVVATSPAESKQTPSVAGQRASDIGLTVRIEINLPADADQETYDRIFRSIRENLLDAGSIS